MQKNSHCIGDLCALSACGIWALFPVIMHPSLNFFTPIFTAGLSTLSAAVLFAVWLIIKGKTQELLDRRAWPAIMYASILIGVVFYGLLYVGARHTSPGNVSLLGLLEIIVAFLLLGKKEKSSPRQFFGAFLMMFGAVFLLFPGRLEINSGDGLVIISCFFPPYGNYFMKKARACVSATTIMLVRSFFAGMVLILTGLFIEGVPTMQQFQASFWYILISGVVLMGVSKIFWIESLIRIPIPKATAFVALAPAITLIASFLILGESPAAHQIGALIPMCLGLIITVSTREIEVGV